MGHSYRKMFKTKNDVNRLRVFELQQQICEQEVASRRAHLAKISALLLNFVRERDAAGTPLHDRHLTAFACKKHRELGNPFPFVASSSWVDIFKLAHNILSRHVTHWVTRASAIAEQTTIEISKNFLATATPISAKYSRAHIFNTDQSGICFEMHADRSLAFRGVKKVERIAKSENDLTHAYTIMPIVSADGVLHPKLFVQMQQKNGKWTAGASVFKAQNKISVPATTHIMSNATDQTFVSNRLLPLLPRRRLAFARLVVMLSQ